MLLFAVFTLGYFAGVFTALAIFPPRTLEISEQEKDALEPILKAKTIEEGNVFAPGTSQPAISP
ncbi:MAG: hypothetical protein AAB875_07360 [Patescibacteria group bacterium]